MRRLTVRDVMTREVITVRTDTSFKEIARRLGEHNISALPVLDESGRLAGVVSEADLLPKTGYRDRAGRSRARGRHGPSSPRALPGCLPPGASLEIVTIHPRLPAA